MGLAKGIFPGRVSWVHDPKSAQWDGNPQSGWFEDKFNDPALADTMLRQSLRLLCGVRTDAEAWVALFRHYNRTHGRGETGYQAGERVAVKINMNCSGRHADSIQGLYNTPQVTKALMRQLVQQAGVRESDLVVYDASRFIPDSVFLPIHAEFPGIRFEDRDGGDGRFKVQPDKKVALHFGDPATPDHGKTYLPACVTGATYLINASVLKGQLSARGGAGSAAALRHALRPRGRRYPAGEPGRPRALEQSREAAVLAEPGHGAGHRTRDGLSRVQDSGRARLLPSEVECRKTTKCKSKSAVKQKDPRGNRMRSNNSSLGNLAQIVAVAGLKVLILLAWAAGGTRQAIGSDYYVGGAGASDGNPGTASQPFATIQKAASVAVAGDFVKIRAGTYRETITPANSGTPGHPITYQPDGKGVVTVSGADAADGGWTVYRGNVYQKTIALPVTAYRERITGNATLLANQVFTTDSNSTDVTLEGLKAE
jgi:hypothetical protein